MELRTTPAPGFEATRDTLQRVAVHIVARARQQSTGRFGLRVTPNGFGTPAFGDDLRRVRVSGSVLIVESAPTGGANSVARTIDGASLGDLAELASVDLAADLDVGHDTPALGDPNEVMTVDGAAAQDLANWFSLVSAALDRVIDSAAAVSSSIQLWPEHFDVALDHAATAERRANLGGSPGDGFHAEPYLYVGPWTEDRPGDAEFWNAPFGGVLPYELVARSDDPVATATEFFLTGLAHLRS